MSRQARKPSGQKQAARYVESSDEEENERVESTQLVASQSQAQTESSLSSQVQGSQAKRQRQSQQERRKIRTGYRQLITDTTSTGYCYIIEFLVLIINLSGKKQEYIQPGADGLNRALGKANNLY